MSMDEDVCAAKASILFLPLLHRYKCAVIKGIPVERGKNSPPQPNPTPTKTDDI